MKHFWLFSSANNIDILAHYHWTLILEIIEDTEIILDYEWNKTFNKIFSLFAADTNIHW